MRISSRVKDLIIHVTLFTLALVLRLPYLMQYPVFRFDELGEDLRAYAIAKLGFTPLTSNAPFIGALYNYLAALSYLILNSVSAFRLLVAITGVLTIPLLYATSLRLTKSRSTSLLAAILLAFSPMHILVSSHVAWSASLMPLLLLAAVYAFIVALESSKRKYWIISGVFLGLALQSHPSVLASYAGLLLALYLLLGRGFLSDLRHNFKYVIAGFLAGYVNMVIYNVAVPLGSVTYAFHAKWTGLSSGLTLSTYLRRLSFLVVEFASGLAAGVPVITLPYLLSTPAFYAVIALAISLVAYGSVKSKLARALVTYLAVSFLILAVGTKGVMTLNPFGFAWGPHYLQQLLPLTYLLTAESVRAIYVWVSRRLRRRHVSIAAVVAVALLLTGWPFTNLIGVYKYMSTNGFTNEVFLSTVRSIKLSYGTEIPLFVGVSKNSPALLTLYMLSVLEGLHPKPDIKLVKEVSDKAVARMLKEFIDSLSPGHEAVIIVRPDKKLLNELRSYLIYKGFKITYFSIVKVGNQHPLYAVVAAGNV